MTKVNNNSLVFIKKILVLAVAIVSFSVMEAHAADLDGDGVADPVSYNCSEALCTLTMSNSSDGSKYEIDIPTTEYSTANATVTTEASGFDPSTGALNLVLGNGMVFRSMPKGVTAMQEYRSIAALSGNTFKDVNPNDLNGFMDKFCVNFSGFPDFVRIIAQIEGLATQIENLLKTLELLKDPSKFVNFNPGNLASCIPNIGVGFNVPTANQFLSCLPNFEGMFAGVGQCMANVANSAGVNVNIPSGQQLQQCVMNNLPSGNINLPNVDPLALINSALSIINSLRSLINGLRVSFPTDLAVGLDWLKNYCRFFSTNTTGISGLSSNGGNSGKFAFKPVSSKSKKSSGNYRFTVGGVAVANCKDQGRGKFSCKAGTN